MAGKDGCPVVLDNVKITVCQMCGTDKQSCCDHRKEINYQKQVDPPIKIRRNKWEDPLTHSKEFYSQQVVPTIVHSGTMEYRPTNDFKGKPANQTGVMYIMNHYAMERPDVEEWINKKKRMAKQNISWVGDGTYLEPRSEVLHFFGYTTHLFLPDPEKPYGNSKEYHPVCTPRDGLDHH